MLSLAISVLGACPRKTQLEGGISLYEKAFDTVVGPGSGIFLVDASLCSGGVSRGSCPANGTKEACEETSQEGKDCKETREREEVKGRSTACAIRKERTGNPPAYGLKLDPFRGLSHFKPPPAFGGGFVFGAVLRRRLMLSPVLDQLLASRVEMPA